MATVRQYVAQLWQRQRLIAVRLGADLKHADKQTRVANQAQLALLAVVIKTAVDKGLITDQELADTLEAALGEAWPEEPWQPPADQP